MFTYGVWQKVKNYEYCRIIDKDGNLITETRKEKDAILITNALNGIKSTDKNSK